MFTGCGRVSIFEPSTALKIQPLEMHILTKMYICMFLYETLLSRPVFFSFYLTNERFIQIAARKTSGQSFVDCRHCSLFSKVKCAIVAFKYAGEVNEVSEIAITFE